MKVRLCSRTRLFSNKMAAEKYSSAKESFVTNLNGTSMLEINFIVSCAPASYMLYCVLAVLFYVKGIKFRKGYLFMIENLLLVLPGLFVITILAGHALLLNVVLASFAAGLTCLLMKRRTKDWKDTDLQTDPSTMTFVYNFRASMNVATILSILAVDFNIFPRRLAKTEVYGTGFMDIGVGSFIFGHAIVSPFARGKLIHHGKSLGRCVIQNFSSSAPLIVLGMLRLLSVKASRYHEHVTEYGVHWNFFFTIAVVKLICEITIQTAPTWIVNRIGFAGAAVCISYQYLLDYLGLKRFVQFGSSGNGSRENLIDANREGIVSCIGYISLFFMACQLGREMFSKRTKMQVSKHLVMTGIVLWLATFISVNYIDLVSRQMANLTYVLWIDDSLGGRVDLGISSQMSLNVFVLVLFEAVEIFQEVIIQRLNINDSQKIQKRFISPRRPLHDKDQRESPKLSTSLIDSLRVPIIVQAISRNQLLYFLLGNVLTGLVNFSMKTIYVDDFTAMIVLILYFLITNGVIVLLHIKGINTKFW